MTPEFNVRSFRPHWTSQSREPIQTPEGRKRHVSQERDVQILEPRWPGNDRPPAANVDDPDSTGRHVYWTTIEPPERPWRQPPPSLANGYIVGRWAGPDGKGRGYLLANGTYFTIEPPGATFTNANGVNPRGEISEICVDSTGKRHGWLSKMGSSRTSTCRSSCDGRAS